MIDRPARNGAGRPRCSNILPVIATAILTLSLTGCSNSPSFDILGSYFPSWIVCCAVAAALTLALHSLFTKLKIVRELWPLPLVYTALFSFLSCTLWLIFFN